jgi:hypothetical protein
MTALVTVLDTVLHFTIETFQSSGAGEGPTTEAETEVA